ncbi:hypothetical protein [Halorussus litoreus]|uniref:hypothetical protein n=1 Tax=Halorussus litoreus TaxID=1710536 RepID=UPI000E262AF9|nr:hypothetical protein [Halorussus litoreus]
MVDFASVAVEWFAVGALLVALGALIKFRQWTFLLAGYDQTSPVPDDFVADVAGNTILRIGLAAVGLGVAFTLADPPSYLATVFEVAVLLAVGRLIYRLHTYAPDSAA